MLGLGTGLNRLSAAEAAAIAGRLSGFTGLLNESFGASAEAAYSVRQLSGSQSVAMTIRRDSDNAETDIGFDSNGNLNEAAIETFCTGTVCKVSSWADQSGNGNDATQSTAATQPTIYTGGALVKENGRVALTSTGNTSFDFTQITDINSVFSVLRPTDFASIRNSFILGDSLNYDYHSGDAGQWLSTAYADTVVQNGSNYLNGTSVNLTTLTRSAGQYVLSMIHTANTAVASTISKDRSLGGRSWIGNRQELIIYSDDRTNQRASIEENVAGYFTQNTPLLDTYSGAAASYSLRKLRSDYSGNAVKVRRASDNVEADIGFSVFKELDTVALAAHCGSSDGFVSVWYDQSSSNNATQTTAANQPKIYDGTTGVVTENGKPAIDLDGSDDFFESSTFSITDGSLAAVFVFRADSFGTYCHSQNGTVRGAYASGDHFFIHSGTTPNVTRTNLSSPTGQALIGWRVNDGTTDLYENGTSVASESYTGSVTTGTTGLDLMQRSNNSSRINGTMQEVIYFGTNKGSDMPDIQSAVNAYYSIY